MVGRGREAVPTSRTRLSKKGGDSFGQRVGSPFPHLLKTMTERVRAGGGGWGNSLWAEDASFLQIAGWTTILLSSSLEIPMATIRPFHNSINKIDKSYI